MSSKKITIYFALTLLLVGAFFTRSYNVKVKKQPTSPLQIVFQNLHYNHDWDIGITASLWGIFIYNNILETLIRLEKNSELVPALASGWTLSSDKKTLKLSISDHYTFHDGTSVTPKDILASLKWTLASSKTTHSKIADFLASDNLDESILLEGNTITIRLKAPLNALIYKLSIPDMGIMSPHYLASKKTKENLGNLSGPYKVINFTPKKMELAKHTGHPLVDGQSPEQVDIVEVSDIDKTIEYYQNNDNVVLVGSGYGKSLKYANLSGGEKYTSDFAYTEFFLPNLESPHLDTLEKRQEIFSIIKKAFSPIEIDDRIAEKTHQIFTSNNLARLNPNSLESLYKGKHSKSQKKKLRVLLFEYVRHNPIPRMINKELQALGIELEIITSDNLSMRKRFEKKDYDLIYLYSGVNALDPLIELTYLFDNSISHSVLNTKHFNNLLKKAETEADREKYISLLKEIHEGLLKEYRILPLLHTRMIYAAKGDYKLRELSYFDGGFKLWDWRKK